jgi:hypothetical protein
MLNVIMLSVVMLDVIMLSAVAPPKAMAGIRQTSLEFLTIIVTVDATFVP